MNAGSTFNNKLTIKVSDWYSISKTSYKFIHLKKLVFEPTAPAKIVFPTKWSLNKFARFGDFNIFWKKVGYDESGSKRRIQVPHSQYLLRKNTKFSQNFRLKKTHWKDIFDQYVYLISEIEIQTWHSKVKTIVYFTKFCGFYKRKFPKLRSKA
jgi:hypothetical protein